MIERHAPRLAFNGLSRNRAESIITKLKPHIIHFKKFLILFQKRIFRLGENFDQRIFVEIFQSATTGKRPQILE